MNCTFVLIDDHELVRSGLRLLIEHEPGWSVVGEAADGREGFEQVVRLKPDCAIVDLMMSEMDGITAVREMRAAGFTGGKVVLSSPEAPGFVREAQAAGADAYVFKLRAFAELKTAIASARRREPFVSLPDASGDQPAGIDLLSSRELEVLCQLALGRNVKEIAFALGLSPKTVETHRANVMAKLEVDNLASLTRLALREGLIKP
jgi:DNA-binding NarL/FixJ family response regulator